MSPTFVTVSSFAAASSETGTSASRRWGTAPSNVSSATRAPPTKTWTWWSTTETASEPPWRNTTSRAVSDEEASRPSSAKGLVLLTPEPIDSHCHRSSMSRTSGAKTRFVSKEAKPREETAGESPGDASGGADTRLIGRPSAPRSRA